MSTMLLHGRHTGCQSPRPQRQQATHRLAASSVFSALSILVFAVPHFIYGGPGMQYGHLSGGNASLIGWNTSTAVEPRRARRYEVCDVVDEAVVDSGGCEGRSRLLEYNEGAVALFVLSQLMLGVVLS